VEMVPEQCGSPLELSSTTKDQLWWSAELLMAEGASKRRGQLRGQIANAAQERARSTRESGSLLRCGTAYRMRGIPMSCDPTWVD
jgi:hypothetical protein